MKRFENILCVVEPDDSSKAAIIQAITLAKNHQAKLTIVSVVRKAGVISAISTNEGKLEKTLQEVAQNKQKQLELFLDSHCKEVKFESKTLIGIGFIEVIQEVLREGHDLVVKCCTNHNWLERVFGSNDMHLLRKCPCPVLMLKPEQLKPCVNILATVDLMDDSIEENDDSRVQKQLNQLVVEYSIALALPNSATLHIGSVWDAYGEDFLRYGAFARMPEEKVDLYVEQSRKKYTNKLEDFSQEIINLAGKDAVEYINPRIHLVKGVAAKEIPVMTQKYAIDLIVMGTVARTGIPGFIIGNTAEAILEQVKCSVLAIKPDGFQTPVTLAKY